ncbi:recombinase family protein [Kitasatospora viridis]|uniref:Resolvase-like protein n=1 Tax=Kitasatospora viridis TaxID=281105 RepID=A0A561TSK7_9ACTN|nr:recombinase family protein [Kitasatospora viridis]TWF90088.1 hypothetical protein FHX73_13132 [Kitasatospora viridis]
MTISTDLLPALSPAAYLRCRAAQPGALEGQRAALRNFAVRLGVPAPVFYEDHTGPDRTAGRCPPRFEALVHEVLAGSHRLLLVPGFWVLAGTEERLRLTLRLLSAAGCGRILALPTPVAPPPLLHQGVAQGPRPGWAPQRSRPLL